MCGAKSRQPDETVTFHGCDGHAAAQIKMPDNLSVVGQP
jgi:hypothetical protein